MAIPGVNFGFCLSCLAHWQDMQCFHGASVMQSKGPTALAALQKHNAHKQRLEDFRHTVEKRLRIRRLARDETLQDAQFISCCKRMLYNSTSLSQFMEGLSFRISHTNLVSPEGSHIDIAWDFEIWHLRILKQVWTIYIFAWLAIDHLPDSCGIYVRACE